MVRGLGEASAAELAVGGAARGVQLAICMAAFVAALWSATVLSIYKSDGRTRWGRSELDARARVRPRRGIANVDV